MTPRPHFRSTAFAPFAVAWGVVAGILLVWIAIRLAEHGFAFGRWLAARPW